MTSVGNSIDFHYRLARGAFRLDAEAAMGLDGITGVFGRSGAGKTSLLRCIAGLDRADEARLAVAGETWDDSSRRVQRRPEARHVGYVPQQHCLFPHLDVRRNLDYGHRRRKSAGGVTFDDLVELLGIAALLDRRPAQLSGGEAQRVALGRAMLSGPRLLLMDEPVAALDLERRQEILPFIRRLHDETHVPVLYVTHSIDDLCFLCDQLLLLDNGRVVASGDLQRLLLETQLPLLGGAEAGVLLAGQVTARDDIDDLSTIDTRAGTMLVPGRAVIGDRVRLRVRAADVSLCIDRAPGTSILNRLPVDVIDVRDESAHSVLVELRAGDERLLARITRRSARELGAVPGARLVAQIKAVSVRRAAP